MQKKDRIDATGAAALLGFTALLAFNQVVIKVVNEGLQPVFWAGLRSAGAIVCVALWMWVRGIPFHIAPGTVRSGLLIGTLFAGEFILLFLALDFTTVARSAVIFYSMPVWLALAAHFLLAGDRMHTSKALGLGLAFAGVVWALFYRPDDQSGATLLGDILALAAAIMWAGIALVAKGSPLSRTPPEMQLLWQVTVSAPLLLGAAFFFGPFVRDLEPIHLWGLLFQIVVVVSFGFIGWLTLLSIYPASGVASFSFLGPIFGLLFGWAFLNEPIGLPLLGALVLVAAGIALINRPAPQVPQKV
ncbi:MAG: DMT family transporter [Rhodobacteraceae bacterium]|nr:DMT family transporter [Paracoccaceae bacterium]